MKLRCRAFSFGLTAVLCLETSIFGQETGSPVLEEIHIPASAILPMEEGIVGVASPFSPEQASAKTQESPNPQSTAPLQSLIKLQGFELVQPANVDSESGTVVQLASEPTLGPPQLPEHLSGIQAANFEASTLQEAIPDDPNVDRAGEIELRVKKYLGNLGEQATIFGGLKVTLPETPPTISGDYRLTSDGAIDPWSGDVYCWTTPGFYHNPLYFEQVNLERYGQGTHPAFQTLVSGSCFFSTIPLLPYYVGNQPWDERVYTLGHYRPGNRNPYRYHHKRFTWRGVVYQVCATTGLVFAVP